jgi:hypothetical protein
MRWIIAIGGSFYGIYFGLLAFRKESQLGAIAYFILAQSGLYLLYAPFVVIPEYLLFPMGIAHGMLYLLSLLSLKEGGKDGIIPASEGFAAFAVRENAKRELSFSFPAARVAGQSPKGSKAANPPVERRRCPEVMKIKMFYPHLITPTIGLTGALSICLCVKGLLAGVCIYLTLLGVLIGSISCIFLLQLWHRSHKNFHNTTTKPRSPAIYEASSMLYLISWGLLQMGRIFCDPYHHIVGIWILSPVLLGILLWVSVRWIKSLKHIRWRRWWLGIMTTSLALFLFFRLHLQQTSFGAVYGIACLFLTGLFPFQLFTPALFRGSTYRTIACIHLGIRTTGLLMAYLGLHEPALWNASFVNTFYFFPIASILLGSILAFRADDLRRFLACNDAIIHGFLVLHNALSPSFPFLGFGSTALALLLVLFIASGFDNGTGEMKNESDFIALFHHHPWPTFIWIMGLISLSGLFPIGHSWQWQLLSVFCANHPKWILGSLITSMVIVFCSYFRWIYAAIRYPYASVKHPLFRVSRVGLVLALIVSLLLCLSWYFSFYES